MARLRALPFIALLGTTGAALATGETETPPAAPPAVTLDPMEAEGVDRELVARCVSEPKLKDYLLQLSDRYLAATAREDRVTVESFSDRIAAGKLRVPSSLDCATPRLKTHLDGMRAAYESRDSASASVLGTPKPDGP